MVEMQEGMRKKGFLRQEKNYAKRVGPTLTELVVGLFELGQYARVLFGLPISQPNPLKNQAKVDRSI